VRSEELKVYVRGILYAKIVARRLVPHAMNYVNECSGFSVFNQTVTVATD
jgi:hypothetical protein